MRSILLLAAALLPLGLAAQQPEVNTRCSSLATLTLDHAKVTAAEFVAAAAPVPGSGLPPANSAFCRVKISDTPSRDSTILTEVWLPAAGRNGSFHGTGNGGFAGTIYYGQMAAALAQGYATAGTDTGHTGGTAEFALGHPEKVKDFGWRAIHDMTVQAKQVAAAFYKKAPAHAYFTACSDGGREALMEAQRFPADYDGILAGAPAYHWTALVPSGSADTQALLATPEAYIPPTKIPGLAAAVLAQCDKLDGVADGVLNDPRDCHFDPAAIACKTGAESDTCLTKPQIASLMTIYAAKHDAQGKQVYPGFLPGAEDGQGGWVPWIVGEKPGASLTAFFGQGYFSDFVYQPGWSFKDASFSKDLKQASETTAAALDANDTNLRPFTGRGGKLILYHGWNDPAIPAEGTIDYYTAAAKLLGKQDAGQSLRLYMVPGMQHCAAGLERPSLARTPTSLAATPSTTSSPRSSAGLNTRKPPVRSTLPEKSSLGPFALTPPRPNMLPVTPQRPRVSPASCLSKWPNPVLIPSKMELWLLAVSACFTRPPGCCPLLLPPPRCMLSLRRHAST